MRTINFNNDIQVALYKNEITGQLSDGMWENSRPRNHYSLWQNCVVKANPSNPGIDFNATKDNYNFTSLLKYVGDRMLVIAKLAHILPSDEIPIVQYLFNDNGTYTGVPQYIQNAQDGYYVTLRNAIQIIIDNEEKLTAIKNAVNDTTYTAKHLKNELNEMKKIIKMQQQ